MGLYTKNGRPLQKSGSQVYTQSGKLVGRISGDKVHGPDGRYVGTIDGDRLVYRSTESASISSSVVGSSVAATAQAASVGSAVWGDEPNIPE
ncbi:hypothetical protein MKK64_04640 [Methylobacterium sp. E-025]|uniref:hypothetical protein n=1 Tax=Methylobacterium sp. E-025 TaxID=2836561 RepID=UPI001FBAD394|nr:hypothetical protein [Methylobacterium sp. E-025]MCJ2110499.1 hypothetical protein [Methylobacterium sp. E-025]